MEFPGAYYHVTCRGNERRPIFKDDDDRITFLEQLERSLKIHDVCLFCYALMPNHFHLLLQTLSPNLSEFMRHFNVTYTVTFNKRHERSGHLYQGRYHAIVVERESYLLELSRYLHLNPVRVAAVREKAGEAESVLEKYPWSSYPGYVQPARRKAFVNYSDLLELFGGDTARGRRRYSQFVRDGIAAKDTDPFGNVVGQLILGSNEFAERLKAQFLSGEESGREMPSVRQIRSALEVEHVLAVTAEALGMDGEQLKRRGKRSEERGLAMELLHRYCCLSQSNIGKLFGGIDYSSVSVNRKKFLTAVERDERLRLAYLNVLKNLKIQE